MDEIWERAVEAALDGQTDFDLVRTLTLDGAVKCAHGRLPTPSLFEKFQNLQHLSMANIGISSLEQFPRLRNMQRLILSDNRIAGGLEFLVGAGLESLRDLDLSNNRISNIGDLRPLADLRLVSLDLYECPVTRMKDYRSQVFGLIRSLKYLDKMDSEENERPESDDEDDDEEEDEDEPGSGEIDGGNRPSRLSNGQPVQNDAIVDADEDEESDADEEEAETRGVVNGNLHQYSNGFRVEAAGVGHENGEEGDSVEEVYEDDEGEDEDVVQVHEIEGSDGVDDDEEDDEEEVDNEERGFGGTESTSRLTSTEGEIDGHEQGEDDADVDDDGETGEEELALEEDAEFEDEEDEEDDYGYLVRPVGRVAGFNEDDLETEEDEDDGEVQELPPSAKRKRSDDDDDSDSDDDDDDGGEAEVEVEAEAEAEDDDEEEDEEDIVQEYVKSSSKHR